MEHTGSEMEVCELLEKKLSAFRRYLSVSLQMKQALERDGDDGLGPLISKRQGCIDSINAIDRDLAGAGGEPEGGIERVPTRTGERIARSINGINDAIEAISPLERELVVMARMESDTRKAALLNLQKTRKATEGYGCRDSRRPSFLDMKS